MSQQEAHIPGSFAEWIVRSLDGTITDEQFASLDREIATNTAARMYYLEFIATYVGLVDLAGVLPKAESIVGTDAVSGPDGPLEQLDAAPGIVERRTPEAARNQDEGALRIGADVSEQDKVREIERYARQQLAAFLAEEHQQRREPDVTGAGWDLWDAVSRATQTAGRLWATGTRVAKTAGTFLLVVGVAVVIGLYIHAHRTLGVLVDSVDAKWDVAIESTGKLQPGRMTLEEGYARIRLKKGAEVILQAPSTFSLQTTNRMFLDNGWLTAKVPPAARGLTIRTPASSFVDHGTEFGLLVGGQSSAEIHVFDGRVGLTSRGNADAAGERQELSEGQAATIDVNGQVNRMAVKSRPHLFVRDMPSGGGFGIPGKRLGLADMIGGGNGLDIGQLGQGIDPTTGQTTAQRKLIKKASAGYVETPSLLFVDGVFVPDANSGPIVITSTGIVFDECPTTCGLCYESINNGAIFRPGSRPAHPGSLLGHVYDSKARPSISMHPNAGITFDLDKIRACTPDARIVRFRALCGLSETVARYFDREWDPRQIKADFWVLIDGHVRFSQKLGAVPPQAQQIDMPIEPADRFLTLAVTNPGDYLYCWGMFAEPMLELTRN